MRAIGWLGLGVVAGLLAGCVGTPVADRPVPKGPVNLTVLFQSNREAVLEPCGCQSKPWGGVDREANAVQAIRREGRAVVYVDSGNLLAPSKPVSPKMLKVYRDKSSTIVKILSSMGLDVLAPGPADLALGLDHLRGLGQVSGFSWVATNLQTSGGAPVFQPYAVIERGGVSIGVVSAMAPAAVKMGDLVITDPGAALERWLPEVRKKADVVILLSQLGTTADEALAEKLEGVHVIAGADSTVTLDEPLWVAGKTLVVDNHQNGFLLGRLDLDLRLPFRGFYDPGTVKRNQSRLAGWREKLASGSEDAVARTTIAQIESQDSLEMIAGGTTFRHELIQLDAGRFGQRNAVTALVRAEKERTRRQALRASE